MLLVGLLLGEVCMIFVGGIEGGQVAPSTMRTDHKHPIFSAMTRTIQTECKHQIEHLPWTRIARG